MIISLVAPMSSIIYIFIKNSICVFVRFVLVNDFVLVKQNVAFKAAVVFTVRFPFLKSSWGSS